MENVIADFNNFINTIVSNGWTEVIIFALIAGAIIWLYNAGQGIYKEMSLKYNPVIAAILAVMAAFVDLIQPNRYRARTAQDIIIQFGTVIVAILFAIIIIILIMSNSDVVSKILHV